MGRVVATLVLVLAAWLAQAAGPPPRLVPDPGPRDLCPVCGMVVAKYPAWVATVLYRDARAHHFDGAKDLVKYLSELNRYAPGRRAGQIAAIVVTEYYGLTRIDARRAFYVIGSDVLGPMGHEPVPLASRADAEEFLRDHGGRRVLSWEELTREGARERMERLDQGRFD